MDSATERLAQRKTPSRACILSTRRDGTDQWLTTKFLSDFLGLENWPYRKGGPAETHCGPVNLLVPITPSRSQFAMWPSNRRAKSGARNSTSSCEKAIRSPRLRL